MIACSPVDVNVRQRRGLWLGEWLYSSSVSDLCLLTTVQLHWAVWCIDCNSSPEWRAVSLADVCGSFDTLHTDDTAADASTDTAVTCVGEMWWQLLRGDEVDEDEDDELYGEVTSPALGVVEQGVVERLVDPTSNLGVCQQHDDLHSGVPCTEHTTSDLALTNDCDVVLRASVHSRSSFLNTYSGCFRPADTSRTAQWH